MDVRFRMKVRDTWYKVGDSDGKEGDVIRVHLTGPDSVATSFTLDRDFLYRKTAQEPPLPVFLGDTWLAGTCLKPLKGDDWHVFTAHDDELLSAGFAFDWTKPFEAIFLIGTTSYDSRWEDVTDHLFPVKIQVKEDGAVGPTYSARGIALEDPGKGQVKLEEEVHTQREMVYRTRRFGEFVSVENLTEFLSFVQVLGAGERITSHVHLKGTGVATSQTFKPDAKGRFCGLAAVRVRFAYGVQKYGDHLVCRAFKPFGEKARRGSGAEPFKYTFTLQVPGQKGQPETVKLGHKIAFPPLPPEREIGDDWDHLRQDRFVTRKELWPMLDIWEVDYAEK